LPKTPTDLLESLLEIEIGILVIFDQLPIKNMFVPMGRLLMGRILNKINLFLQRADQSVFIA
jgi:hypothetical protein